MSGAADRQIPRRADRDVTIRTGVQDVLHGGVPVAKGRLERVQVLCMVHVPQSPQRAAAFVGDPAQCHGPAIVRRAFEKHRPVVRVVKRVDDRLSALHANRVENRLEGPVRSFEPVALPRRVELQREVVDLIGPGVGEGPRDVIVEGLDERRRPRHGDAVAVHRRRHQMRFVPDSRQAERKMHVARQDRGSRRRARPGDGPVVRPLAGTIPLGHRTG